MKPVIDEREKREADTGSVERGYAAWKLAKIERGLAESRNRDAMIAVEQVWRDISLEGRVYLAGATQSMIKLLSID